MSSVSATASGAASSVAVRQTQPSAADTAIVASTVTNSSAGSAVAVVVDLTELAKAVAHALGQKDFDTVANDARTLIDHAYQQRDGAADARASAAEWQEIYATLDRRSLFAVATNHGGQFSELEQTQAKMMLARQQAATLELGHPAGNDPSAALNATVSYIELLQP